jgi:hypothetical protein
VDELEGSIKVALQPYLQLMDGFTAGRISATDFAPEFTGRYLNDATLWPDELFVLLDGLFAEADAYVADPVARVEVIGAISGEELLRYAMQVHTGLNALLGGGVQHG